MNNRLLILLLFLAMFGWPLASRSQTDTACPPVKIADFPKGDLPARLDTMWAKSAGFKLLESYKYYYGIGVPVDYVKARYLAFIEMKMHPEGGGDFEGASILLMLYANGFGVKRDLDISIRLACSNVGGAGAEVEGRVDHLKNMRSDTSAAIFDLCDDITSGYMMGMCTSVKSQLDDLRREAIVDSVIKGWPAKDREAYDSLRKAAGYFFYERTIGEVDLSGTARAMMEIDESESLEESFKDEIVQADKCAVATHTEQDFVEADKKLNTVYTKLMKQKDPEQASDRGQVTRAGIRSAQRAWIRYRDAWAVFGAVRCPETAVWSWKTVITEERVSELEELFESRE